MGVLVDSHSLIWAVDDPSRLTHTATLTLQDPASQLLVSAATVCEVAIKVATGKLNLFGPYRTWMTMALADLGATVLPITIDYADAQAGLPFHHRDPFDRLLIAQALTDGVPIVSADTQFDAYGVTRIW